MATAATENIRRTVSPIVLVPDRRELLSDLPRMLSTADWQHAQGQPDEKRRRHFLIGRIAARFAIGRLLGSLDPLFGIEVGRGTNGEPRVLLNGRPGLASVSISHSGLLAAACAWQDQWASGLSVGVDVEMLRMSDVATSPYAFSSRERELLSDISPDASRVGIVAWSAKEAAWKALCPTSDCGPECIEIRHLDLSGWVDMEIRHALLRRLRGRQLLTRFTFVQAGDREYVLSFAKVQSFRAQAGNAATGDKFAWSKSHEPN